MLIHEFLTTNAKEYPEKVAVVYQKQRLTYARLDTYSDGFAALLMKNGITSGDRVVLFLDNCCEYLISYFGTLKCSAVVVALNSQLLARELRLPISDCGGKVIVTDNKHLETANAVLEGGQGNVSIINVDQIDYSQVSEISKNPDCSEGELAMIIYTSGTTGKPKGVMLSHRNLSANADSIIEYLRLSSEDRIMVVLPFYYSYGNSLLTTHIKLGATLVLDNRFVYPNVILETMKKEAVTGFAGVPSHYAILINKSAIRSYQFPKLRYVTQAGGGMSKAMIQRFLDILPDIKFYVMYGQTEASARLSYLEPEFLLEKMGSIGKAIPGVDLEVLNDSGNKVAPDEVGEIVARGENITQGYWNDPDETKKVLKDKRLFTGDLARIDEDDFIYIISRKKDMIKSGANRISPLEIEDVVSRFSGVMECAVVGVPDEILGEAIKLFVVVCDSQLEERDIRIFCKQNLAIYKLPKEVEIVSELPKTGSGKIKRQELV